MSGLHFTRHALERCQERGIDPEEVITALTSCRTRVLEADARSVTFAFRRLRIVCNSKDGSIVTLPILTDKTSAQKTQAKVSKV